MVFIAVGTQKQQFTRIFEKIEKSKNLEREELIAQAGFTKYETNKIKMFEFIEQENLDKYIEESEYIICHGGIGTIFSALEKNKKVLVVPRLKKYKEHVNDHQLEICRQLQKEGYIVYLDDNEDLDTKIEELKNAVFKKYINDNDYLEILKNVI